MKPDKRLSLLGVALAIILSRGGTASAQDEFIALPEPERKGALSLEETLASRRSQHVVDTAKLPLAIIGQLLWATQGITVPQAGIRAAPSAGRRHPLRTYVLLSSGLYRYQPQGHQLVLRNAKDVRRGLWSAVHENPRLVRAPAMILIAASHKRTIQRYGAKGRRFVLMEAGHASQNLLLQTTALGLHGAGTSDFDAIRTRRAVDLPIDQELLYVFAVGRPSPRAR